MNFPPKSRNYKQGLQISSLGWDDPPEKGMATHSSILAWRIPMGRGTWRACSPWGHKNRT